MEGVPADVIEERLNYKMNKKKVKLEKELQKMGINVDDSKFNIKDYDVPEPRPKRRRMEGPPPGFFFPPMGMPPGMGPPPMMGGPPGMPP